MDVKLWLSARLAASIVKRRPALSAFVVGLVAVVGGSWIWWATQLRGLPDISEPFDLAATGTVDIPAGRNAFVEYRHVSTLLRRPWPKSGPSIPGDFDSREEWSNADPAWRDHVEASRDALAVWLRGTARPDALYLQPKDVNAGTILPVIDDLKGLGRMAAMEGTLRLDRDDPAGAWTWFRAILRSSRHCGRHGCMIERSVGVALHAVAYRRLAKWAADPRVDAALLREALAEVIAVDARTPPASDGLKMEYRMFLKLLGEHGDALDRNLALIASPPSSGDLSSCWKYWAAPGARGAVQGACLALKDERERSLRVGRLLVANWLAQVDKPAGLRAEAVHQGPLIYRSGGGDPPASRAISPEDLARWYDSSFIVTRSIPDPARWLRTLQGERVRQAKLIVVLASELYRRDRGTAPAHPKVLVGPYLGSLPEGYDSADDAPAR